MNEDKEIRTFNIELRVDNGKPPSIDGYAAVFDQLSDDLGGFREKMENGFFDDALFGDTRALFNHDRNVVLGRSTNNTLRMTQDDYGLRVHIDPPQTQLVTDMLLIPMKRGDIDQMSFAFTVKPDGEDWDFKSKPAIRTLKKGGALMLYDVSVVTLPAYPQTSAQVRSKIQELQQANPQAESDGSEALTVRQMARRRRLQIADRSIK